MSAIEPTPDELGDAADMAEVDEETLAARLGVPVASLRGEDIDPATLGAEATVTVQHRPHLIDGEFQSDKYPTCPRGKVPLSCKDPTAQDLLWEYAQRRRAVDGEFASDLEEALRIAGHIPRVAWYRFPLESDEGNALESLLRTLQHDVQHGHLSDELRPLLSLIPKLLDERGSAPGAVRGDEPPHLTTCDTCHGPVDRSGFTTAAAIASCDDAADLLLEGRDATIATLRADLEKTREGLANFQVRYNDHLLQYAYLEAEFRRENEARLGAEARFTAEEEAHLKTQADLKASQSLVEKLEGPASASCPTILARLRAIIDNLKPHTGWASSNDILDNIGRLDGLARWLLQRLRRSQELHQRALAANRALRGPRKRKTRKVRK